MLVTFEVIDLIEIINYIPADDCGIQFKAYL